MAKTGFGRSRRKRDCGGSYPSGLGAIALMLPAANRLLTIGKIKAALLGSTRRVGKTGRDEMRFVAAEA
jgi:hypothetical protein